MQNKTHRLSRVLIGKNADTGELTRSVDALAEACDWSMKETIAVQITIDEIFSNMAKYGKLTETCAVGIDIISSGKEIALTMTDPGIPFNLLNYAPETQKETSAGVSIGGRGIDLVLKLMDRVQYERQGELNKLTFVKTRNA